MTELKEKETKINTHNVTKREINQLLDTKHQFLQPVTEYLNASERLLKFRKKNKELVTKLEIDKLTKVTTKRNYINDFIQYIKLLFKKLQLMKFRNRNKELAGLNTRSTVDE